MRLLLVGDTIPYPPVEGVFISQIYRPVGKWLRLIRLIHHLSGLFPRYKTYWLESWKNKLSQYDQVAIFDSMLDDFPIDVLVRNNIKVIFCYRNKVSNPITHSKMTRNPNKLSAKYNCELWSYNKKDCERYCIHYYNQFHLIPKNMIMGASSITSDVFFIGTDKGRIQLLIDIIEKLRSYYHLNCDFRVIPDRNNYSEVEKNILASKMSYTEVLQKVASTRCVVDVVTKVNEGLTFRCLEATVFKKKLITNFNDIVYQDFYDSNNIFIWGKDDASKLVDFIFSEYKDPGVNVYEQYSFRNFVNRLFDC